MPKVYKAKKGGERSSNVIYYPFKNLSASPPFLVKAIFVPERHLY
jgi:hypothetical protein